jgi:hypothetical protein
MIDVIHKHCAENNCDKRPNFNYNGEKRGLYCSDHIKKGMVDVVHKRCSEVGCIIQPVYNYLGTKQGKYCVSHAKNGMVNVKDKTCLQIGCIKRPNYNYENENIGIYCAKHSANDMINVTSKKCIYKGCIIKPSFNYCTELQGIYCVDHALEEMVDVKNKKCEHIDCDTRPTYNYNGFKIARFCFDHKELYMIDVCNNKCIVKNCHIRANFGIPGFKPTYCATHKLSNMIFNSSHLCETEMCNNVAIFGHKKAISCEDHMIDTMINLIENECKSCGLVNILNNENLCTYCDPEHFNICRGAKEKKIKSWLNTNNYEILSHDTIINGGECIKSRPDFILESINKTHYIVIEVDEHQHKHSNYLEECECTRMINISQALGMPVIFIRYNPDEYITNKTKFNPSHNSRVDVLNQWLNWTLNKTFDEINNIGFCSLIQLFYDGYTETSTEYKTLLPFINENNDIIDVKIGYAV